MGDTARVDDIIDFVKQHLDPLITLKMVNVSDESPKSEAGKILR